MEKFAPKYQEHVGIYSAGIGVKQLHKPITMATIQSLHKTTPEQKPTKIFIDECHLLPPKDTGGMYWDYISQIPDVQIIGFTATDFRTDSGSLQWGEEIVHIPIAPLIERGHLVAPINKAPCKPDLSDVDIRLGEYVLSELEEVFLEPELLSESVKKIIAYAKDRSSVLIFCQSIKHMKVLSTALADNGVESVCVDGDTPKDELESITLKFQQRQIKFMLNCQLMTTGTDLPCLDMVVVLRSTVSKGLFEQMVYRGTRPYEGKKDFLLLDMGGNLVRHGGLGSPYKGKSRREASKAAGIVCPACESYVSITADRICMDCGYQFSEPEIQKVNHETEHDEKSDAVYDPNPVKTYDVYDVTYCEHIKRGAEKKRSIRVDYFCPEAERSNVSEWISPWSDSDWARNKAWEFFRDRGKEIFISGDDDISFYSADALLKYCQELRKPTQIVVDQSGKYNRIKDYIYGGEQEEEGGGGVSDTAGADPLDDDYIPF